jgi:hypothetical protein
VTGAAQKLLTVVAGRGVMGADRVIRAELATFEGAPHVAAGCQHACRPLVPHRSAFGPAAQNVRISKTPNEFPGQAPATMSHAVGLQIPEPAQISGARPNGNFGAQQLARFGATPASPDRLGPRWRQQPIQGRRTDLADQLPVPSAQALKAALVVRQPLPQARPSRWPHGCSACSQMNCPTDWISR